MLFWEPLHVEGLSEIEHLAILKRLDDELRSWEDTPFLVGQMIKGMGVDCIHFVCAVLDSMYRKSRAHRLPRLRYDAALHRCNGTQEAVDVIRILYPDHQQIHDRHLQPGDVATTGPENGGVGHIVIAGPEQNTFWHAQGRSVRKSGLDVLGKVYNLQGAAYRVTNKRDWL
jgi:hypothetical protein